MTATPSYQAGSIALASATGAETVVVGNGSPQLTTLTTAQIAALSSSELSVAKITALNTVGAGTITAAGIAGQNTTRGGTQIAAFSDTTATGTAIVAALIAGFPVGGSFIWTYVNNTAYPATIGGGSGVTVSGVTVVPPRSSVRYLVTYTVLNTFTIVAVSTSFQTNASGTIVNNGASAVTTADANVTPSSVVVITLKTVGGTVGAIPHLATVTPGTGFTTVGTASDTSTYNYLILG